MTSGSLDTWSGGGIERTNPVGAMSELPPPLLGGVGSMTGAGEGLAVGADVGMTNVGVARGGGAVGMIVGAPAMTDRGVRR